VVFRASRSTRNERSIGKPQIDLTPRCYECLEPALGDIVAKDADEL
jgi:hypothetical protein